MMASIAPMPAAFPPAAVDGKTPASAAADAPASPINASRRESPHSFDDSPMTHLLPVSPGGRNHSIRAALRTILLQTRAGSR